MSRLSRLSFGLLLLAAAFFSTSCDSTSSNDPDPSLTGVWTATTSVDWSKTYVLPSWSRVDSVHYRRLGTHTYTFDLTQSGNALTGTVTRSDDGIFYNTEFVDGEATTWIDDRSQEREPEEVRGTITGSAISFAPPSNYWIEPLTAVNLTLSGEELRGQVLFQYATTLWAEPNGSGSFTTNFEFPISLRLVRQIGSRPSVNT